MKKVSFLFILFAFLASVVVGGEFSRAGEDNGANSTNINYLSIENLNNPILEFTLNSDAIEKNKIGTFTNKPVLICDKEIGGTYEFIDNTKVKLYVESKLNSSEIYKCRVNQTLFPEITQEINIKTKEFAVISSDFINQIDTLIISLEFNDRVNYSSMKNAISLKDKNNLSVNYDIYPKADAKKYNIIYNSKNSIVDLKLNNLESSSFKKLNYFETYNASANIDNTLSDYDIKKFPVIPIYNNDGSISLEFKYLGEIEDKNIKDFIHIEPQTKFYVVKVNRYYWEKESKIRLHGDFKPNTNYQITFKKGLEFNKEGNYYQLKENSIKTVTTANRNSHISFLDTKNYLSSLAKEIVVKSVNNEEIEVVVDRLVDDNLRYFINFENSYDYEYNFYKYSDVIFNKKIKTNCPENEICEFPISLKDIVQSKHGVYRVKVYTKNSDTKNRFLNFSDIAISAKLFRDEIFVSVSSLAINQPFYNATVTLYDSKNRELLQGKSDFFGIFRAKLKNLSCKQPAFLVIENAKGDKNYLMLDNAIDGLSINCENLSNNKIESFIYLDREIARPNDKLNALFVLKDNNFKSKENIPLKIQIKDPIGTEVYNETHKTDAYGIIEDEIEIPNDYKTGRYQISVKYFDAQVGYKELMVEDFIPHKIKNSLSLDKDSYFINEPIKAKVGSKYLFGTPASGLNAEVSFSIIEKNFKSKKYEDYSFTNKNPYESFEKLEIDKVTKKTTLDKNGFANVIFEQTSVDVPSILQGMISLSVFDDGRAVSKYKTVDIYPYKNLIGIKRVNEGYGESGHEEKFKIALIDTNESEIAPRILNVEIKKALWHYYSDVYDIETISKMSIKSNETLSFTPQNSGQYIVTISDPLYEHISSETFYVSGWSYDPVRAKNESQKVEVLVKDDIYKPGDEIKVGIKSPLAGRMIITMEDSKLLDYKIIDLKNNTAALNLQVPYGATDNFYIKAYIIRDTSEDDKIVPFRAFGKKFIKVDKSKHKAEINFDIKEKYISKTKARFEVTTNVEDGYVILSVVDMGILNIIGQMPPKPFEFFLTKEYKTSSTYDFYDNLVSHIYKKVDKYGSGVALHNKMKKHLPPDSLNKRVKPFSFYSKKVKIVDKKALIDVDIPNFNGRARVVAIVVAKEQIAASDKEIVIKDDVILKPTFPRFLSEGDKLLIPVRIFNTTKSDKELSLRVEVTNANALIDEKVSLKASSFKVKHITLEVLKKPNVHLKVIATENGKTYYSDVDMPSKDTKSLKSFTKGGEGNSVINFSVSKDIFAYGNPYVNVAISTTYLSEFKKDFDSLVSYPYGCAEQTSSKILAMLNVEKFLDKEDKNYQNIIKENNFYIDAGIDKLSRMQKYNGEFSYWANGEYVNDFASIYASDVLLEANDKKFEVNSQIITKIYEALDNYARYSSDNTKKLYALYILSKYKTIDLALINSIYDNGSYYDGLTDHYLMAALLKKANLTNEYKKVYDEIVAYDLTKNVNLRTYSGNFYSHIKDVAFSLFIHLENFPKDNMSERMLEVIVKYIRDRNLYSTQDKAFVLRALNSYYKEQISTDLNATVTLNSKPHTITKPKTLSEKMMENYIKITPNSNSTVNYLIEVNHKAEYALKKVNVDDSTKELAIDATYLDTNGNIVNLDNIKVGDKVYVEVELKSKRMIENVVVNLQIPSNFEIVNIRLDKENKDSKFENYNFKANYLDIRDDRELIFLDVNGLVRFYVPLRAVTKGVSKFPPILTEAMYDSRINDYTKEIETIEVK